MSGVLAAFTLFVALHSIPAIPTLRARIVAAIGRPTYLVAYSAVSTAVLVWLFYEALNTDYVELWSPASWQIRTALITAPVGLFFVITGLLSSNPFSVTIRRDNGKAGAIVAVTRHPVLWGFFIWAAGHVVANGDLRSLILFGGFAAFSVGGIKMSEKRGRQKLGDGWRDAAEGTSVVPFVAFLKSRRLRLDLAIVAGGIVTLALTAWLLGGGHAALVGVDPLSTLGALQSS